MKSKIKRLFRAICVLFGKKRYTKIEVEPGFIIHYDYIDQVQFMFIKDISNYLKFPSVVEALKNDIFHSVLTESNINIAEPLNNLVYIFEKQQLNSKKYGI